MKSFSPRGFVLLVGLLAVFDAAVGSTFSVSFNGRDAGLLLPANRGAELKVDEELTLSAFVKARSLDFTEPMAIVTRRAAVCGKINYAFSLDEARNLRFEHDAASSKRVYMSTSSIDDMEWHHVAVTFKPSTNTITFYIDGAAAGSSPATFRLKDYGGTLTIGRNGDCSAANAFSGEVSFVSVWSSALSAAQVSALKDRRPAAGESNLVSFFPLDQGSGSTAADAVGSSRAVTLNGSASWDSLALPHVSSALAEPAVVRTATADLTSGSGPAGVGNSSYNTLWLSASAIGGVANGGTVATWADSSGNGVTLVQSDSAKRPKMVSSSMNSQPAVRFSGAHASLSASIAGTALGGGKFGGFLGIHTDATVYVVAKDDASSGAVSNNDYATLGSGGDLLLRVGREAGARDVAQVGNQTAATANATSSGGARIVRITKRAQGSTTSVEVFRTNGNASSSTGGREASTASASALALQVGGDLNDAVAAEIAELAVFNVALNSAQRALVEGFFAGKYGVSGVSPSYAHASSHSGKVSGIGRAAVDSSHLAGTSGELTIAGDLDAVEDGEYVFFGYDGAASFNNLHADVPTSAGVRRRTARVWRVSVRSGRAFVPVSARVALGSLPVWHNGLGTVLLTSTSASFENATVVAGNLVNDELRIASIEARDGMYVSIGERDLTPPVPGRVWINRFDAHENNQSLVYTLSAKWDGFRDAETDVVKYEWAIGTTRGGTEFQPFQTVFNVDARAGTLSAAGDLATYAVRSDLSFQEHQTYYVSVRATNRVGLTTTIVSGGVRIDGGRRWRIEAESVSLDDLGNTRDGHIPNETPPLDYIDKNYRHPGLNDSRSPLAASDLNAPTRRSCAEILANGESKEFAPNVDYFVDPFSNGSSVRVLCDMTTMGGGWTLVSQQRPYTEEPLAAHDLCTADSIGEFDLTELALSAPAKLSDKAINALLASGRREMLIKFQHDAPSGSAPLSWTRQCLVNFTNAFTFNAASSSTSNATELASPAITCTDGAVYRAIGVADALAWNETTQTESSVAGGLCGFNYLVKKDGDSTSTRHVVAFSARSNVAFRYNNAPSCGNSRGYAAGRTWVDAEDRGCSAAKVYVR